MRRIRIGVAGGEFGAQFFWHVHPRSTVTAVADLRPERRDLLRRTYRCDRLHDSLESLVRDREVDAVAVFTPAPLHARHAILALRAGKHVVSAVPAAMTLDECQALIDTVQQTGLTYMMAETSVYRPEAMAARQWHAQGRFGEIFYTEAEYWHERLDDLFHDSHGRTWRYGFPPMHYPTHATAFPLRVTGERLVEVRCIGWGDDSPVLQDNAYGNPFWNEVAFFTTDRGHASRIAVGWHLGHPEVERATWYGSRMCFAMPNGLGGPAAISESRDVSHPPLPDFQAALPPPLRLPSGHGGSHVFLTHEFVSALVEERRPAIDIHEAVAYTAPGIVAHQSALRDGEVLRIPSFARA